MDDFDQTSGELARRAGTTTPAVVRYAELGLLEYRRLSNGMRLFRASDAELVREIRRQRLANRGKRRA